MATQPSDAAGDGHQRPAPPTPAEPTVARFGLTTATALIVGTIIGVGIFNLPTSLAGYGPISLVSMALTTVGALALALLFASLARRLPADGRVLAELHPAAHKLGVRGGGRHRDLRRLRAAVHAALAQIGAAPPQELVARVG